MKKLRNRQNLLCPFIVCLSANSGLTDEATKQFVQAPCRWLSVYDLPGILNSQIFVWTDLNT
jgi:hypothetical protein